ncbi:metallophosphoesterase family protein [Thermosediminibacter oceani]|uniref:Metallophosphoesterase n=1 Tax=Thermosediminibacter oceani (strain ATCC BAA-1034 / DSM 16646 / JW/IW-1228P) TaxID=555079 RepID=D9S3J4_THEOJ|nr:metallophosphoesterase [Thermosediminibacter oceani]ADL07971.1 metallophosphoesterase [Thermosediminibacter oceani DSM 16646]
MRFLFFTDTHIRGTIPQNRKDNFLETLFKKIREVVDIAHEEAVDVVLHGGDIFDRPDVSPSLIREFVVLIRDLKAPIYAVAGNHDIYGQNPATINRTMLGVLDSIGIVKLINPGEKIFFNDNGIKIQLTGQHYYYGLDKEGKEDGYCIKKDPGVNFAVHVVHGMLLDKPFFTGVSYTLIEDVLKTEADLTLCGHYHAGFGIINIQDKYFVNPGSLLRIDSSLSELTRIPGVILFDITNEGIKIKKRALKCALPGQEVFDRQKLEADSFREKKLAEFIQGINSAGEYNFTNIFNIIDELAKKQNLSAEVVKEALRRIGEVQETISKKDGEDLEVS